MALAGAMTKLYLEFSTCPLLTVNFDITYIFKAMFLAAPYFALFQVLLGARGVLKIAPSESMREEPPKKGKRILLERVHFYGNVFLSAGSW